MVPKTYFNLPIFEYPKPISASPFLNIRPNFFYEHVEISRNTTKIKKSGKNAVWSVLQIEGIFSLAHCQLI